jgi:hypothetical protein
VRASRPLPEAFAIPNALSLERNGTTATAVVRDWSDELHRDVRTRLDAQLEVESLALEEIFLELHR